MLILPDGVRKKKTLNYVGAGSHSQHSVAGLVLDLEAARATGNTPNSNIGVNKGTWYDLSGNNNNFPLTGFSYTTSSGWASAGAAYYLAMAANNTNYLTLAGGTMPYTAPLTYDIWCSCSNASAAAGFLPNTSEYTEGGFGFTLTSSSFTVGLFVIGVGYHTEYTVSGTWSTINHFIIRINNNSTCDLYINGTQITANHTDTYTATQSGYKQYYINASPWDSSYGTIAANVYSFRVYNIALTSAQILQNYRAGYIWPS